MLDTFNLLAAAVRRGLSEIARSTGQKLPAVAKALGLDAYIGRSIKGTADIDWSDADQRGEFLGRLVADARTVKAEICRLQALGGPTPPGNSDDDDDTDEDDPASQGDLLGTDTPPPSLPGPGPTPDGAALAAVCATIDKIINHDVEMDPDGKVQGVLQRPAGDRAISATDPEMRHGHKSASVLIAGYKTQIVAAITYGWILLTRVIPANRHDGDDLPVMVEELDGYGIQPRAWMGDHAYGLLSNHAWFQEHARNGGYATELIARNARPANGGRFTKDEFEIDLDARTLRCPRGHTCSNPPAATRNGKRGWLFKFPVAVCGGCTLRDKCVNPKAGEDKGRSIFVHPETERLLRVHLERRREPEFLRLLVQRQVVERANAGFAQCGGKQARRFGLDNVGFDTRLTAVAHNLRTLAALVAKDPELHQQLARARYVGHLRTRSGVTPAVSSAISCHEAALAIIFAVLAARQRRI